MELQAFWPAPTKWKEEDSEVELPRLGRLWELHPFDWKQGLKLV